MKKYSILIVDDENNVVNLLEKLLIKQSYIIYKANCEETALKVIDSHQIDLVITDASIELVSKISDTDSSIKVILITPFTTIKIAIEAFRMGVVDYITKPLNLERVLASVEKVLNDKERNNFEELFKKDNKSVENYFSSKNDKMQQAIQLMNQAANSKAAVILYGATGTGKELAAQVIHNLSPRAEKPFIKVNCAAIPESSLEIELLGYNNSSFTGASASKAGLFELSDGGSIFLDEIEDITPSMQLKLLRFLQEREFGRLGMTKTPKNDFRIIAATNKNLEELVKIEKFRQDLYYRLNIIPIVLPLLSNRREDIFYLSDYFLQKYANVSGKRKKMLSNEALNKLKNYCWQGNIRELENVIERCIAITSATIIELKNLPQYILNYDGYTKDNTTKGLNNAVDSAEKNMIFKVLRECFGNKTRASEVLGISKRTIYRKIAKYNIEG